MAKTNHQPKRRNLTVQCIGKYFAVGMITSAMLLGTVTAQAANSSEASLDIIPPGTAISITPAAANSPLPDGVDPATGFRMQRYRSPVPDYLPGAETVDTAKAHALHREGKVIFVDVFPPKGLGADPLNGHWLITETHNHIARSTWLPEVGRGYIEDGHASYFKRNLQRITDHNKAAALLFYCTADCWQSWNAARRAVQWGYQNVFWYPDGTDGWAEEDYPLVPAIPINFLEP